MNLTRRTADTILHQNAANTFSTFPQLFFKSGFRKMSASAMINDDAIFHHMFLVAKFTSAIEIFNVARYPCPTWVLHIRYHVNFLVCGERGPEARVSRRVVMDDVVDITPTFSDRRRSANNRNDNFWHWIVWWLGPRVL